MREATIYALVDPRDEAVRYVGKTTWSLAHRLKSHRADAKANPHTHKSRWLNVLDRAGVTAGIIELERVEEGLWEDAERRWIVKYAATVTNATCGGQVGGWGWRPGEQCPAAKLTEVAVREICMRYAGGGVTQAHLAAEYRVTVGAIARIVRGDTWKHVERPTVVRRPGAPGVSRNKGNRHGARDYVS